MQARSPAVETGAATRLAALGERIRMQRKRLGVSAVTAAEAAGVSRVTLHRIERGEPSVTIGAYVNAATALGLSLELTGAAGDPKSKPPPAGPPAAVRLDDYPNCAASRGSCAERPS